MKELYDLCCLADEVVSDMKSYDLLSNNCQNFCNQLLIKMKITDTPFSTTFHMDTSSSKLDHEGSMFDCFSVVLQKVYGMAINNASGVVATAGATVLTGIVNAPTDDQRLNNLTTIYKLLCPLAPNWKEIRMKLSTSDKATQN